MAAIRADTPIAADSVNKLQSELMREALHKFSDGLSESQLADAEAKIDRQMLREVHARLFKSENQP